MNKRMMMIIVLLGMLAHGMVCAESTTNQALKCAVHFEIQALRTMPVIDADYPDTAENKNRYWPVSVIRLKMINKPASGVRDNS
jgi:hypothetical protein